MLLQLHELHAMIVPCPVCIGKHLVDAVASAVQRCSGMALQASADRDMRMAIGLEGIISGGSRQWHDSAMRWCV